VADDNTFLNFFLHSLLTSIAFHSKSIFYWINQVSKTNKEGIPKNSIAAHPSKTIPIANSIHFSNEDTDQAVKFLDEARSENRRVVVFEYNSRLYNACFQKDRDILLNPKKDDGYSWDILGELEGNYLAFTKAMIRSSELNEEDQKNAEEYFFTVLSNLPQLVSNITTINILNKLIFHSFKSLSVDLIGTLGEDNKDILEKYLKIRNYLALKFNHLKPLSSYTRELSIREYEKKHEGGILFNSCFCDADEIKTQKMIIDFCRPNNVLRVFASKITT
jgi:hypothetical protein